MRGGVESRKAAAAAGKLATGKLARVAAELLRATGKLAAGKLARKAFRSNLLTLASCQLTSGQLAFSSARQRIRLGVFLDVVPDIAERGGDVAARLVDDGIV